MKKLLLAALTTLLSVSPVFAQRLVVVTEDYPPFNFMDSHNKVSGISTEVVEEVLKRAKIEYTINLYPWARAYQMAQDSPNVLIYSIGRNEKRETQFKWVDVIAPYNVYFYKLKTREDIKITKLDDVRSYRIGAVNHDVRAQYLEKKGIRLDLVVDDRTNAKKLAAGRIDLFPIDELGMAALYKREGIDPGSLEKVLKLSELPSGLYMAFSQQTSDEIVNKCKSALEKVKKDGSYERILSKYLE